MPGEVTNHGEKPVHYSYLKEFRTQQCPDFLQHKCAHHRPYTCFHWHFLNQKRRRPIRKKDGSFNYSPDIYCSKYDETSGVCPDGDECPLLHRIAGDVERRYHLRYFKTCPCVYETDSRGQCTKNGPHCAFAHGMDDLRQPVYDCHDLERMLDGQKGSDDGSGDLLSSSLEKDMLYNEDPVWNDPNYVLAHYKTEVCRRPHRLCRQGYACPSFHNSRDKRRSPKTHKYRSTPCPNVKHGDEWGDPPQCENGDSCTYCHTRTEQQFHPEIYKSTKCNDMMQTGYCPRGQFCAFAHIEKELNAQWDVFATGEPSLAEFVENVLPHDEQGSILGEHRELSLGKVDEKDKSNGCRKLSAEAVVNCGTSIWNSNNSSGLVNLPEPIGKRRTVSLSEGTPIGQFKLHSSDRDERRALMKHVQMMESRLTIDTNDSILGGRSAHPLLSSFIANNSGSFPGVGSTPSTPLSSNMSPHAAPFYPGEDTVESVIVSALDEDLGLVGLNLSSYDKDNEDSNSVCSSLSTSFPSFGSCFGSHSVPMSIPAATDYTQLGSSFSGSFGQSFDMTSFGSSFPLTSLSALQSQQAKIEHQSLLKNPCGSLFGEVGSGSYPGYGGSSSALIGSSGSQYKLGSGGQAGQGDVPRLREELSMCQLKLAKWEEGIQQARIACEAWRKEMEESNNKAKKAEEERQLIARQRDEALTLAAALKKELDALKRGPLRCLQSVGDVDRLSGQALQALKAQLLRDLEAVEQRLSSSVRCVMCDAASAGLVELQCNHCMCCACMAKTKKCPRCQADVSRMADVAGSM